MTDKRMIAVFHYDNGRCGSEPYRYEELKRGEWEEKEVVDYEETTITQWQSACCSVCGKYHTTPYLYYFDDFNFCPNCGADMRKEGE